MTNYEEEKKLPKNVINWEITCYDKTFSNVYFIRNFA